MEQQQSVPSLSAHLEKSMSAVGPAFTMGFRPLTKGKAGKQERGARGTTHIVGCAAPRLTRGASSRFQRGYSSASADNKLSYTPKKIHRS